VATTDALAPDLIAITGDFVTATPTRYATPLAAGLRELWACVGVVVRCGNHDPWSDAAKVREALVAGNVRELNNDAHIMRRSGAGPCLAGIDEHQEGKSRLDQVLERLRSAEGVGGRAILLAHEPNFADVSTATGRVDLQLSSHSHGGQAQLP
jgi:predicted MPP superfamily phosphohydrolase